MATPATPATAAPAAPGALASVSGWFSDFVKSVTPVAQTYLTYQGQKDMAKANEKSVAQMQVEANAAARRMDDGWRDVVANDAKPVTAQPWFPYAIGGGVLLIFGFFFLALRGKR